MNKEINLLPDKKKEVSKTLEQLNKLRYISLVSMFIVAFFAVALFLLIQFSPLNFYLSQEQAGLATVTKHAVSLQKLYFLTDRVQYSSTLINSRIPYDQTIAFVSGLLPSDVRITSVNLDKKDIKIDLTSSTLASLNTVLSTIETEVDKKTIKEVTMNSLIYGGSDTYTMSLTLTLQ